MRPLDHSNAVSTVRRSSAIKWSRPELQFDRTSLPQPLSRTTPPLAHRQEGGIAAAGPLLPCVARELRRCPRWTTADWWPCCLSPSLFSLPNPLPFITAAARSRNRRILHRTVVRSSPELPRGHGRDEELDADGPVHPSTCNSPQHLPLASAADPHHLHPLPSPLGEHPSTTVPPARRRRQILVATDALNVGRWILIHCLKNC